MKLTITYDRYIMHVEDAHKNIGIRTVIKHIPHVQFKQVKDQEVTIEYNNLKELCHIFVDAMKWFDRSFGEIKFALSHGEFKYDNFKHLEVEFKKDGIEKISIIK